MSTIVECSSSPCIAFWHYLRSLEIYMYYNHVAWLNTLPIFETSRPYITISHLPRFRIYFVSILRWCHNLGTQNSSWTRLMIFAQISSYEILSQLRAALSPFMVPWRFQICYLWCAGGTGRLAWYWRWVFLATKATHAQRYIDIIFT